MNRVRSGRQIESGLILNAPRSAVIQVRMKLSDQGSTIVGKRRAAEWAASQLEDGMAVGLGSGTTSALVIQEIGKKVSAGLKIIAIATSQASERLAHSLDIPITDFGRLERLDLTIDGADEVDQASLHLIKGHGGALLREKIVAMASRRFLIAVDSTKIVTKLGSVFPVPVEVVPFGWQTTAARLREQGFLPQIRVNTDGTPYLTDGKHYILHCDLAHSPFSPKEAAEGIKRTVGVVEHGLFLGMASQVGVGDDNGLRVLDNCKLIAP
jgi:ribose 5-phosphate isomerase A